MILSRTCFARFTIPMLAILFPGLIATQTRANLVATVMSSTATAGGTGSFDVVLSSTSGAFGVSGFSIELQVASNSGVNFTSVNTATTPPYLFGTIQSPPLTFNSFPNTDFVASDSDFTSPFFVTVTPGASFGLEHVNYSVAPGTVGPINVSIVGLTDPAPASQIDDVSGTPFVFTPVNGNISLVPEPSALMIYGFGSLILLARTRRRGSAIER